MFDPRDQRMLRLVELIEQTGLFTSGELKIMEDYLFGDTDGQEVEKLAFRDLSAINSHISLEISRKFEELIDRGKNEEAEKLARIFFTVGESTSWQLFAIRNLYSEKSSILSSQPVKRAALYASAVSANRYLMRKESIYNLRGIVHNRAEDIKAALVYQKGQSKDGEIILLATYFLIKYPYKGLKKEGEIAIEQCDVSLMKQYEDDLVYSIPRLYRNLSNLELDEIMNAIDNNHVSERILKLAGTNIATNYSVLSLLCEMSFLNFALSSRLRNVVAICAAADTNTALEMMGHVDIRGDLNTIGGYFDEIFGISSEKLVGWAARKKNMEILKEQFAHNSEAFLTYMEKADFDTYSFMVPVLKEMDPELWKSRQSKEVLRQQEKIVQAFTNTVDAQVRNDVKKYLSGEEGIEILYASEDKMASGSYYGGREWNALKSYQRTYGYDWFSDRCDTYMLFCKGYCHYYYLLESGGIVNAAEVKRLISVADAEKLDLKHQVNGFARITDCFTGYMSKATDQMIEIAKEIFGAYLKERREETLAAFRDADSLGRFFGIHVLSSEAEENKEEILKYSEDTAKTVKEALLEVLYNQKGWEEDIQNFLSSKKAAVRETGISVLAKWDIGKYTPLLTELLEKEKNKKVRTLLENLLHISGEEASSGGTITQMDFVKEIHKGNKKRSLEWAYNTPFSKVHRKSGEEASEEYLQAVLLCYSTMGTCGVSQSAASLAAELDEAEFAIYVNELFDKWMEAGAEAKKRWVLYAAAIHGGDDIVKKLHHQIQEWPKVSRGAIAAEAVQALALNPQPQALLIVDGISRKFKFKQIKAAAGKALEFAASQLGITKEELADRIVPDLGFNENMERCFDYGTRKFTVTITTALEIEVFDENGKKLKNLPAPGKRDEEEKAAAAYDEFKQMKKQMKATVSSQKMRLDLALSTERQWSISAWTDLFVKNPVMHQFAIGLVWGLYEERKLVASFRYMEDGSFNTEEEEEFELPKEADQSGQVIGLVHPIELSEESREAWKQQLEDYEIIQPIEQLARPVFYRTAEEENQKSLERFGGYILNDLSLGGKLQTLGWYRGSVQDAGGFYTYYREDPELSMGVELHFSGSSVGYEMGDVTVYEARFYDAGSIKRGSYMYDETDDNNSYLLKDVPERYFSEIVLQLTKAVASSKEKNVNWKEKR